MATCFLDRTTHVHVCVEASCPLVTSFSLWLSIAQPLPDKIHNFYLMVQSGWAFWRTLPEIDGSHFRSTEDANYPLGTLWGCWSNTDSLSSFCCLSCFRSFSSWFPPLPVCPFLSQPKNSFLLLLPSSSFPAHFILTFCCLSTESSLY